MKQSLLYIATSLLFILTSCGNKINDIPNEYRITGFIADSISNGQTAYLRCSKGMLDSTLINGNTFEFNGFTDSTDICRIDIGQHFSYFILEKGDISIDMHLPTNPAGTKLNDLLCNIHTNHNFILESFMNKADAIWRKYDISDDQKDSLFDENYGTMCDSINSMMIPYLKDNNDNALGAYLLWTLEEYNMPRYIDSLYSGIAGNAIKNNPTIKKVISRTRKLIQTEEGAKYKDFPVTNPSLNRGMFSDYISNDKYKLVFFFASWCESCKEQYKYIDDAAKQFGSDSLDIIGVTVWDKPDNLNNLGKRFNHDYKLVSADNNVAAESYGVQGIPFIMILGPDGDIIRRDIRGNDILKSLKALIR